MHRAIRNLSGGTMFCRRRAQIPHVRTLPQLPPLFPKLAMLELMLIQIRTG